MNRDKINWEKVKEELEYIAVADHMGDVNDGLPSLAKALGFKAAYHNDRERTVFEWEEGCSDCLTTPEDLKYSYGKCECEDGVYKPVNLVEQAEEW